MPGNIAASGLNCSSIVMKDPIPLTFLVHERNTICKCKQRTFHDFKGPEIFKKKNINLLQK